MLPSRDPLDGAVAQSERYRVEMTVSCRDCDVLPKIEGAGTVVDHDGTAVQLMHNGLKVHAGGYYGDWMSEIIERLNGHHEPQEEVAFTEVMRLLPDQATMIELGAFWSYYTLWFLSEAPGSRTAIAMEPDPYNLDVGRRNAELNGLHPTFVQGFVGGTSSASEDFQTETAGVVQIPRYTVAQLMEENGIDHLTVLHCDTQGAETSVLESCRELATAGRLEWLVFSTHVHHISGDPLTHQKCLALIAELGGQILVEHDVQESFSGDGLIVAHLGATAWKAVPLTYNRTSTHLFRSPLIDLAEAEAQVAHLHEALAAETAKAEQLRGEVARLKARVTKGKEEDPPPPPIAAEVARLARRTVGGARRRLTRG